MMIVFISELFLIQLLVTADSCWGREG